jgi:hypothetical protein
VIAIGREDVWPLLRRCAELGGNVRTGLEDTFYLPDGKRATSRYPSLVVDGERHGGSGQLIGELVSTLRSVGREPGWLHPRGVVAEHSCSECGGDTGDSQGPKVMCVEMLNQIK